jgi:DNA-binding transcriptional LysR family regulator
MTQQLIVHLGRHQQSARSWFLRPVLQTGPRRSAPCQKPTYATPRWRRCATLQDHVDDHARAAGHALTLRIRMKTFEGMCEMVAQGVGVGVMPQGIARRYRRRHGYRALTLTDDWARRRLCLCFRDWATLSPTMQSLLSHLEGKPD